MSKSDDVRALVGDAELIVRDMRLTSSLNDLARADLTVSFADDQVPDWTRPLTIEVDATRVHTGSILSAVPDVRGVRIVSVTGVEMNEMLMSAMAAHDFPAQDLVFAAARSAGFTRDRMEIHGLDELPVEPIEVAFSLRDVRVSTQTRVGLVTLVPSEIGARLLELFQDVPPAISQVWSEADAFAITFVNAHVLAEAEAEAIEVVDTALAWLAMRARFGHAQLPGRVIAEYSREAARGLPMRSGAMAVRGLRTGRRWLRDPETVAKREAVDPTAGGLAWPPFADDLALSDRQALAAARRAASTSDLVAKATAISVAWEFYCGHVSSPTVLDGKQRRRLKQDLPAWLSSRQRYRVIDLLKLANNLPLWHRVREALEDDGVPVSASEWTVMKRVRDVRNRAVHGSEALDVDADDLDLALSVLARALVFRLAGLAEQALEIEEHGR